MSLSQNAQAIVTNLVNAIKGQISSHYNITGNSSTKGHVQAGGVPQSIGNSLSAGTDNGYYARADHVHTCSYNNLKDKPTIPTNTNQLTNGAGFITSSNVPSASNTTPSSDTTSGSVGTGTTWARADHEHPKSNLYAEANHTHTYSNIDNVSIVNLQINYSDNTSETVKLLKYTGS